MNDFNNMLKQAQELQNKMADAQKKVEQLEAEGSSGGGLIKIIVDGKNLVKSVHIDNSLINNDEKEILEDLIIAAHGDAKQKVKIKTSEELSKITAGMSLPPNFKWPF